MFVIGVMYVMCIWARYVMWCKKTTGHDSNEYAVSHSVFLMTTTTAELCVEQQHGIKHVGRAATNKVG